MEAFHLGKNVTQARLIDCFPVYKEETINEKDFAVQFIPLRIENRENIDSGQYEILGEASASAAGIMLFNVIPIRQNTRFQRAYDAAVRSKGGDFLIDVEVSERWFWAWILNGYITTVKGTAVKRR